MLRIAEGKGGSSIVYGGSLRAEESGGKDEGAAKQKGLSILSYYF